MRKAWSLIRFSTLAVGSTAFSTIPISTTAPLPVSTRASSLSAVNGNHHDRDNTSRICNDECTFATLSTRALTTAAISLAILTSPLHNAATTNIARADEWGKETEAPTLFTGETVMICKRRGPLGACLETTVRTVDNDNDKALKYFKDPSAEVKRRQEKMLQSMADDSEGSALIQKLRQQSLDNKEKNDNIVRQKTLLNDQGASFGPFNAQVVILNTDGKTFTLLQNPQAMRLKKAGYIEDRKFVIQPSQGVIDEALEGKNDLGGAIKGFFGGVTGGDGGGEEVEAQVEVKNEADSASSVGVVVEDSMGAGDNDVVKDAGEVTSDSS